MLILGAAGLLFGLACRGTYICSSIRLLRSDVFSRQESSLSPMLGGRTFVASCISLPTASKSTAVSCFWTATDILHLSVCLIVNV